MTTFNRIFEGIARTKRTLAASASTSSHTSQPSSATIDPASTLALLLAKLSWTKLTDSCKTTILIAYVHGEPPNLQTVQPLPKISPRATKHNTHPASTLAGRSAYATGFDCRIKLEYFCAAGGASAKRHGVAVAAIAVACHAASTASAANASSIPPTYAARHGTASITGPAQA